MSKVTYASLKLKTDPSVSTFDYNGQTIEVKNYLPIDEKYDLIMVTLQKSQEGAIYNELKLDMYFHLNIVYLYTNLSFTDKQREDESKLYDCLKSNGIIDEVIDAMPDDEYESLWDSLTHIEQDILTYNTTAAALIRSIINDLPSSAEAAAQIVDSFDPNQYQAVIDFADAANGGRPRSGPNKNKEN